MKTDYIRPVFVHRYDATRRCRKSCTALQKRYSRAKFAIRRQYFSANSSRALKSSGRIVDSAPVVCAAAAVLLKQDALSALIPPGGWKTSRSSLLIYRAPAHGQVQARR
jgi:hypothetical protein